MNHGVVEQFGTPKEIYDHPATMFVADFIGSPPMNFLRFEGSFRPGDRSVTLGGVEIGTPEMLQEAGGRKLALGVRPEHVALVDNAEYRGRIEAVEYLGTTLIVTLQTPHGTLKARIPSDQKPQVGSAVGLRFAASTLCLFDEGSGRAFRTSSNAGVLHG
jgi:multiple sugar transport system ATP-binding protein